MTSVPALHSDHQVYAAGKTRRPNGDRPGAGHLFGDAMLALLGRALAMRDDAWADSLPGGMRSTAQMFNEHGFFDDTSPPVAAAESAEISPTSPIQLAMAPPAALSGDAVTALDIPCVDASSLSVSQTALLGKGQTANDHVAISRNSTSRSPAAPGPASALAVSALRVPGQVETPVSRNAARRPLTPQGTTRLKVMLDHGEAGVAVSVTTDGDVPGDHENMRDAVSQMLARHGLVLSELRINRRAQVDQGRRLNAGDNPGYERIDQRISGSDGRCDKRVRAEL